MWIQYDEQKQQVCQTYAFDVFFSIKKVGEDYILLSFKDKERQSVAIFKDIMVVAKYAATGWLVKVDTSRRPLAGIYKEFTDAIK